MNKIARALFLSLILSGCLYSLQADTTYRIYLKDGKILETSRKPVFVYGKVLYRAPTGQTISIPVRLVDLKATRLAAADPDLPAVITDKNLKELDLEFNKEKKILSLLLADWGYTGPDDTRIARKFGYLVFNQTDLILLMESIA